jgi:Na+-driven multidrug efflux pump
MVTMETLFVISQVVDMIWIGRLGSSAIAGVGIANIVIMLVMSMDMGLIVGVRALIARHVGEGDIPGANHVAGQALLLAAGWGALMMIIGFSLAGKIMGVFGMEDQVVNEGMAYCRDVRRLGGHGLISNVLIYLPILRRHHNAYAGRSQHQGCTHYTLSFPGIGFMDIPRHGSQGCSYQ